MDIDSLLAVHEQDADVRPTVEKIRSMRDAITGVEGMRYLPAREAELTDAIKANAAKAGADDLRAMLADAAREDSDAIEARDDNERERLESMNGHQVDPGRFTAAATAGEVSALLRDAEVDPDSLRRAWQFALPKLREMAGREMREHRLPGATSAFSAMTIWQSKMAGLTRQAPTRQVMSDRAARRQRELKEKTLATWRVVGLDLMVAKHLLAADISERTPDNGTPAKGALQVGRYFDQFKQR